MIAMSVTLQNHWFEPETGKSSCGHHLLIHTLELQEHSENYPQTITKEKDDDSFKASLTCFKETTGLEKSLSSKLNPMIFKDRTSYVQSAFTLDELS
jgi:hypothetical protein